MPVLSILRPRFSSLLLVCHSAYARAQLAAANPMALDSLPYLFILGPASIRRAFVTARHSFSLTSRVAAWSAVAVLAYLLSALLRRSEPVFGDDGSYQRAVRPAEPTTRQKKTLMGTPSSRAPIPAHISSIYKLSPHSEHGLLTSTSSPFTLPGGLTFVVVQSAYRYSYYAIRPLLSALLVGRSTDSLVVKCLHHADRILVLPAPDVTNSLVSAPPPGIQADAPSSPSLLQDRELPTLPESDTDATLVDEDLNANSDSTKDKEVDVPVAFPGLPDTSHTRPLSHSSRSVRFTSDRSSITAGSLTLTRSASPASAAGSDSTAAASVSTSSKKTRFFTFPRRPRASRPDFNSISEGGALARGLAQHARTVSAPLRPPQDLLEAHRRERGDGDASGEAESDERAHEHAHGRKFSIGFGFGRVRRVSRKLHKPRHDHDHEHDRDHHHSLDHGRGREVVRGNEEGREDRDAHPRTRERVTSEAANGLRAFVLDLRGMTRPGVV